MKKTPGRCFFLHEMGKSFSYNIKNLIAAIALQMNLKDVFYIKNVGTYNGLLFETTFRPTFVNSLDNVTFTLQRFRPIIETKNVLQNQSLSER